MSKVPLEIGEWSGAENEKPKMAEKTKIAENGANFDMNSQLSQTFCGLIIAPLASLAPLLLNILRNVKYVSTVHNVLMQNGVPSSRSLRKKLTQGQFFELNNIQVMTKKYENVQSF